jgi:hypothetical protein
LLKLLQVAGIHDLLSPTADDHTPTRSLGLKLFITGPPIVGHDEAVASQLRLGLRRLDIE